MLNVEKSFVKLQNVEHQINHFFNPYLPGPKHAYVVNLHKILNKPLQKTNLLKQSYDSVEKVQKDKIQTLPSRRKVSSLTIIDRQKFTENYKGLFASTSFVKEGVIKPKQQDLLHHKSQWSTTNRKIKTKNNLAQQNSSDYLSSYKESIYSPNRRKKKIQKQVKSIQKIQKQDETKKVQAIQYAQQIFNQNYNFNIIFIPDEFLGFLKIRQVNQYKYISSLHATITDICQLTNNTIQIPNLKVNSDGFIKINVDTLHQKVKRSIKGMIFRLQIIGNNELIIDKYIYFGENTPDSEKKVIKSIQSYLHILQNIKIRLKVKKQTISKLPPIRHQSQQRNQILAKFKDRPKFSRSLSNLKNVNK